MVISTGCWLLALRLCTALGTLIGASIVAMAFALGLTMLLTLIKLDMARKGGLLVTPLAVLLAWMLFLDGQLSR